jgi:hypothetical protein
MKPLTKIQKKGVRKPVDSLLNKADARSAFRLKPISNKEREAYQVPVYDYILP